MNPEGVDGVNRKGITVRSIHTLEGIHEPVKPLTAFPCILEKARKYAHGHEQGFHRLFPVFKTLFMDSTVRFSLSHFLELKDCETGNLYPWALPWGI